MKFILKTLLFGTLIANSIAFTQQNQNTFNYDDCSKNNDGDYLIYDFPSKQFYYHKDSARETTFVKVKRLNTIKLKYNRGFRIKVVNINRYIYNIGLNTSDIHFESDPPPIFNSYFLGQMDGLNELVDNNNKADSLFGNEIEDPIGSMEAFIKSYMMFKTNYDKLIDNIVLSENYKETFSCSNSDNNVKYSDMSKQLDEVVLAYNIAYIDVNSELAELEKQNTFRTNLMTECTKMEEDLKALKEAKPLDAKKIKDLQDKINSSDCSKLKDNLIELNLKIKKITFKKAILDTLWKKSLKPLDEQIINLIIFNNNLVKENQHFTSPPIYPQGNRFKLELTIKPNDSSRVVKYGLMPTYSDSLSIELPVLWKPFISFSSGPFFTMGNNLGNELHTWQKQSVGGVVTDSAQYKLVATGTANNPVGISAFANIGVKPTTWFGFGGSIGVGISLEENPKPTYFAGGSIFLGDKRQFNVTAGFAATHVRYLDTNTYPDIANTSYDTEPSEINYNTTIRFGGFIAISYTLYTLGNNKTTSSKNKISK